MRVIVTGAAGHLGPLVPEQLLKRLEPDERILVTRRPDALRDCDGATIRYGDFDDPPSLEPAFQGADRMLLIGTDALGRPRRPRAPRRRRPAPPPPPPPAPRRDRSRRPSRRSTHRLRLARQP